MHRHHPDRRFLLASESGWAGRQGHRAWRVLSFLQFVTSEFAACGVLCCIGLSVSAEAVSGILRDLLFVRWVTVPPSRGEGKREKPSCLGTP